MKSSQENHMQTEDFIKNQDKCIRCGKCCLEGGPALHLQDKVLVDRKQIPLEQLFTIRSGEPAFDNVQGKTIWASSDIIKIKGKGSSWECVFFDKNKNSCGIYQCRPLECRIFKCWDTGDSENLYTQNYLTRKDLVSSIKGLWDLIKDHQQQCSYGLVKQILEESNEHSVILEEKQILKMISYDKIIRTKTIELVEINPMWTDFLFGQPMSIALKRIGIYKFMNKNQFRLTKRPERLNILNTEE